MFKRIGVIAAVVAAGALAVAPIGSAAKPADPGQSGRCVAAAWGRSSGLGAISAAARGEVDYAPYGTNGLGLIRVALPTGSFLPLSTVISLPRANPGLFAWCDNV